VHEVTQLAEAAVVENTPSPASPSHEAQPERPAVAEANPEVADALAIIQAMPDHIFRIGKDGVSLLPRNGSRAVAGAASGATGVEKSPDGKAVAHEADKPRPLEKTILEELGRQNEPHTRKVLETKQLQTFEFQVRDDREVHHLEVRLTPFRESEVLALVRDVTVLRQTHNALIESKNELENHLKERNAEMMRVNKMLKTEVELREEQEEVLKKNFHKLEGLLDDTIGAITLIVERRDPHVADHQRRVCQLASAIAQEMHSRNDRMRAIRMAAQLHDLGKTFIPAEILRKPGKLTEAEMSMVRTHPDTDYQILKRINFPISIADVVRQHHERMDGSGYPQGLKGEDILIEARIIAVADVIEGMVFERPYRVAPGLEAALKEIADNKGTLYDPAVADACLKLFAEKRFQFESMPGQENAVSVGPASDHRDS
jgi:HD-GYP domain-containing protein (c-di-GMP phosphodiesterase class II)